MNFGQKQEQIKHCRIRYQRIIISKNDQRVLKCDQNMLANLFTSICNNCMDKYQEQGLN